MDTIYLHGITVECVIGVHEWERRITQQLVIDLDIRTDTTAAAAADDIGKTLNYSEVSKRVSELARASEYHLIESIAAAIAATVLDEFGAAGVRVKVEKSGAAGRVGVIIERERGAQAKQTKKTVRRKKAV